MEQEKMMENRRVVDTRTYVSVLRELTREGKEVSLLISGSSMSPFLIHNRDYIIFKQAQFPLKKGDMVFYQRDNSAFVMHRIYKITNEGYYMVGDAQKDIEGPLRQDQIFAQITKVKRGDKWIGPGDFWWEFFEHIWIHMIPVRGILVKIYGYIYRKKKR